MLSVLILVKKTQLKYILEWIYGVGTPIGNEEVYANKYERHNAEVREYFKDRPNDLLILPLETTNKWEKLCYFLGKPIPEIKYPHANIGNKNRLINVVKNLRNLW